LTSEKITMPLALDKDGFLRRECPNCERQFKVLPGESNTNEISVSAYSCPYCVENAAADSWWTKEQLEYATKYASAKIVEPKLDKFAKDIKRLNKPAGFVRFDVKHQTQSLPNTLQEPNDMRKITLPCHPNEPLKIYEGWKGPVACLICGELFDQTAVDK